MTAEWGSEKLLFPSVAVLLLMPDLSLCGNSGLRPAHPFRSEIALLAPASA
jgi:hypothetical protein